MSKVEHIALASHARLSPRFATRASNAYDAAPACRSGRDDIERAYLQERKAHLEQCEAEMGQMFERRSALEAEFMERYLTMVESYQKQLFDLQARSGSALSMQW